VERKRRRESPRENGLKIMDVMQASLVGRQSALER
jgi:hypothetical protein